MPIRLLLKRTAKLGQRVLWPILPMLALNPDLTFKTPQFEVAIDRGARVLCSNTQYKETAE